MEAAYRSPVRRGALLSGSTAEPALPPLQLARLPTPLERLDAHSEALGLELWIKRDDLTGLGLSGNKVRKLAFLLAEARAQGADTVVTCGGIQSNHCRATAVAARRLGLDPVLLLRGQPPHAAQGPDGNLLLDAVLGAEIHWTDPSGYAERDARMAALAGALRARGRRPYIIPEGGSNSVGALGFVHAAHEVAVQVRDRALPPFDSVVCAVGSGGTVAGLAAGRRGPDGLGARVLGIAVCDDRAYFRARIDPVRADLAARGHASEAEDYDILDGWQGRGYALSTPEELTGQVAFARQTGLFLDPVYTGKAWGALLDLARDRRSLLGERVLFWHTGGAFGLFGRGAELVAALAPGDPGRSTVRSTGQE